MLDRWLRRAICEDIDSGYSSDTAVLGSLAMVTAMKYAALYASKLSRVLLELPREITEGIGYLAQSFMTAWTEGKTIYLCGNGGSAGNAIHLANDFTYGAGIKRGIGLRIEALPANAAVITCLANDIGYENIFSEQLRVKANVGDVLVVLSGSGNSANVVNALEMGNKLGMTTFAVLGYDGGKCKSLAQHPIHFAVDDMQIAEDLQLIVGHMVMQWLYENG
jgi:D-sedoheptulose 7-phosphate isomerase